MSKNSMKPGSTQDLNYLPDNLPECHKLITDLRNEIKALKSSAVEMAEEMKILKTRMAELEQQLRVRNRMIFGKSSAKVPAASLTGTGKVVYDQSFNELESEKADLKIAPNENKHGGGGRTAPKNAPQQREIEHKITEPQALACPACSQPRKVIGFEVSYQLDIIKTIFETLKHIQYRYACPDCEEQVALAPKPYQPIDKGYATPGLIAHIGVSKFDWHLPLYRQERIYLAESVPLARSSMCRWLKEAADMLDIIVKRMHQLMLDSRLIQSDSTGMPVIKKGLGQTHKGSTWLYRDDKYMLYKFTETGEGIHPETVLAGFKGVLLTDGADVFNGVIRGGATKAGCWSHLFRYFEEARKEDERADYALAIIKSLFDIERVAAELPEEERKDLRHRLSKPKLVVLKSWADEIRQSVLPKDPLGKGLTYLQNQWDALCLYADTGFVPSHNNASENGLRPAVLGRRNWLFAGSVEGGHTAAIWMTLVHTCRRLKINPFDYLKDTLARLPATPTSQIDQFLPDKWKELQETTKNNTETS
jgi:transposase